MIPAFHFDPISFNNIAYASASRIVDCVVEGSLVAAFADLLLRAARRWNSGTRFAVWFCALTAVAALPFFGAMFAGMFGSVGWSHGAVPSPAALTRPEVMLPGSWASWLFGTWAGIAAIGLARVVVGLWRLRGLRQRCIQVDLALLDDELQETLTRFSLSNRTRSPVLCVSERVSVPTVIGFVNPTVVIPPWLMNELSPSELKQVLLHELAHLQRWDDWTNLAQKILKALMFFHPAVWWIEKQLSLEREMACDDVVIAETANPRAYAECLTHLAEKSFVRRSLALAQAALGRIRQTSLRVAQILDTDQVRTSRSSWRPAMALVAAFAFVSAIGISRAPKLVGFENNSSASTQVASASRGPNVPLAASFSSRLNQALLDQPGLDQQATRADSTSTPRRVQARLRGSELHAIPAKSTAQNIEQAQRGLFQGESFPGASGPGFSWSVAIADANAMSRIVTSDLFYSPDSTTGLRPVTQVFVIFESRGSLPSAQAAYRISVWRVIVQPSASSPDSNSGSNKIPHKET